MEKIRRKERERSVIIVGCLGGGEGGLIEWRGGQILLEFDFSSGDLGGRRLPAEVFFIPFFFYMGFGLLSLVQGLNGSGVIFYNLMIAE